MPNYYILKIKGEKDTVTKKLKTLVREAGKIDQYMTIRRSIINDGSITIGEMTFTTCTFIANTRKK